MDKTDYIIEKCKHLKTLDIGCVGGWDYGIEGMKNSLHLKLRESIPNLTGVDMVEEGVESLNKLGANCHVSLAEDVPELGLGKFEAILIGDIIEHIPDPCAFLKSLRPILTDDGIIVCTTPNALSYTYPLMRLLGMEVTRYQHTAWYCTITIQNIFLYAGYNALDITCTDYHKHLTKYKTLRIMFEKPLFAWRPEMRPHLCSTFQIDNTFTEGKTVELQKTRTPLKPSR